MPIGSVRHLVAIAATLPVLLTSVPTSAETFYPGWRFNPPPGVNVVQGRPRHALAIQANTYVSPVYLRQVVAYQSHERAGTIIVDSRSYFLYLVLGNGQALRY